MSEELLAHLHETSRARSTTMTTGRMAAIEPADTLATPKETSRLRLRRGAAIEPLDTYGMTPLHRMASNNLPIGARMLLEAGQGVPGSRVHGYLLRVCSQGPTARQPALCRSSTRRASEWEVVTLLRC